MLRIILLITAFTLASVLTKAQEGYLHYDPIPYVPPPELPAYTPPSYPVMPPPNYRQAPSSNGETIVAIFSVETAKANDMDMSDEFIKQEGKLVLYIKNNTANMAVIRMKTGTQSYGLIENLETNKIPATPTTFDAAVSTFLWTFKNNYDSDTGKAAVTLTQFNDPSGVTYYCSVKTSKYLFVYRGHKVR